jgi:hypothetical protein
MLHKTARNAVRGLFPKCLLALLIGAAANAAEIQGVVTDWRCTENMVRNGREKVLQQDRSCSLARNPDRAEYGLITDDKKFYHLDAEGNKKVNRLLHNSPDKDNLRVILTGDVQGNLIKVTYASIL